MTVWACPHCSDAVSATSEWSAHALRCPHCAGIFWAPKSKHESSAAVDLPPAAGAVTYVAPESTLRVLPSDPPPRHYRKGAYAITAGVWLFLFGIRIAGLLLRVSKLAAIWSYRKLMPLVRWLIQSDGAARHVRRAMAALVQMLFWIVWSVGMVIVLHLRLARRLISYAYRLREQTRRMREKPVCSAAA